MRNFVSKHTGEFGRSDAVRIVPVLTPVNRQTWRALSKTVADGEKWKSPRAACSATNQSLPRQFRSSHRVLRVVI